MSTNGIPIDREKLEQLVLPRPGGFLRPSRFLGVLARTILKTRDLDTIYRKAVDLDPRMPFSDRILKALKISYTVTPQAHHRLPASGGVMVVANHPFGGVEGLVLHSLLTSVRRDVKILANQFLACVDVPEFRDMFIFVDPFESREAVRNNIGPLREALNWLKGGGVLGIFPSGTVSSFQVRQWQIADPRWHPVVGKLIRKAESPVLPVFFKGSNSRLFLTLGLLHPGLRTAMLAREVLNKADRVIEARAGKLLSPERLSRFRDDRGLLDFVRMKTYLLRNSEGRPDRRGWGGWRENVAAPSGHALPKKGSGESMAAEIDSLEASRVLISGGRYQVFRTFASVTPRVVEEIGRLREVTFRRVGEGTGKAVDLDRFDEHYEHLVLWNTERREIVGAYRFAMSDRVIRQHGIKGLYTSTLFNFSPGFFHCIHPAIELGRAFVRAEYQKSYQPLLLLWKGIGRIVAEEPRYRALFGSVTVSNSYQGISRRLIVTFFQRNGGNPELSRLVRSRNPVTIHPMLARRLQSYCAPLQDLDDLSEVISELEADRKGLPILLKHYTRLGGQVLAFNIDPQFGYAMDALILVDLRQSDPAVLERYMGTEGLAAFQAYHQPAQADYGREGAA